MNAVGEQEKGYSTLAVVVALLTTLIWPFISIVVAFILLWHSVDALRRARPDRKQEQLRTWAWGSVGWLALGFLIVVLKYVP